VVYRDDLEAAQARIADLERQLALVRAELEASREQRSQALVLAERGALAARGDTRERSPATRWLGAPVRLAFSRRVSGELPTSAHIEIIELVRERVGEVGAVSQLEGSLAWTTTANQRGVGPFITVTVTSRDGATAIRVEERLGNLAGAVYGGIGGGVGGGALGLPIMAAVFLGPVGALAIPAWLGGWWLGVRAIYRRAARQRAERLQALTEELAAVVDRRAGPRSGAAGSDSP
jgi:hypothetical protein